MLTLSDPLVLSLWAVSEILHSEYSISKMCSLTYIKKLRGDLEVRGHFISLLSLIVLQFTA